MPNVLLSFKATCMGACGCIGMVASGDMYTYNVVI